MTITIQPLYWPDRWIRRSRWQDFLRDVPLVGLNAWTHRHICQQLRGRSEVALALWPHRPPHVSLLSAMIQEYMLWPNAFFIPDDPCQILLWDTTLELRAVEAMLKMEDDFQIPRDVMEHIVDMTYGQLVDAVAV